jgi:hypothetical protein
LHIRRLPAAAQQLNSVMQCFFHNAVIVLIHATLPHPMDYPAALNPLTAGIHSRSIAPFVCAWFCLSPPWPAMHCRILQRGLR